MSENVGWGFLNNPSVRARAVWAQHFDPHLLVNYLPLLFHLCIQMGLSLWKPPSSQVSASFSSSPTSSSFCTCEESYSRKTPPPTPIPRRSPTANAPERSALKRAGNSADYRRKSPAQRWSNEVMRWVGEGRPNVSTLGGLRKVHCGVMDGP